MSDVTTQPNMEYLPMELLCNVLSWAPRETYRGKCSGVCRKWRIAVRHLRPFLFKNRFFAYEKAWIFPKILQLDHSVMSLSVGQDGNVYSITYDGTIRRWCETVVPSSHSSYVSVTVGVDGRIWAGTRHGGIELWDDGTCIKVLDKDSGSVNAIVWNKGHVYSGTSDGVVRVWSEDGECLRTIAGQDAIKSIAVGHDRIYAGARNGVILVWSKSGELLQTLKGHTDYVYSLAFGHNGRIYSGSNDRTIRVWGEEGQHLQTLKMLEDVLALTVVNNGLVFSASYRTIHVLNEDGARLWTLEGHTKLITSIVIGQDGRVYSGSHDGTVRVWR